MVQMCPNMWLVIVTLLWNTFWLNVENSQELDKDYDAGNLQQLFQEISVTYVFESARDTTVYL